MSTVYSKSTLEEEGRGGDVRARTWVKRRRRRRRRRKLPKVYSKLTQ